jgi:hypothetical protein
MAVTKIYKRPTYTKCPLRQFPTHMVTIMWWFKRGDDMWHDHNPDYQIFFSPRPGQLSSPFFPCVRFVIFFKFHFQFYCHFVSLLPFSLLFSNSFSFFFFPPLFLLFLFPAISHRFFFCPSCSTQTLLPSSLHWFNTVRLHPPSEFQCYWIAHCSHLLPPLDFPLSFSPHYYVPWSLGPALGNFTVE